ncbi:hypothetical protein KA977_08490 [Candidatus Dependentiae bacterium]|nr:hypothetical protein [Candidatus Dependentiae bacterium]
MMIIDAKNLYYKDLNQQIRNKIIAGETHFKLINVLGHRYIGDGIGNGVKIEVEGIAGNDMGAFMNGAEIIVHGNAQDGIANTMNSGTIIVHGQAGDTLCYGMRGGKVFIREDVGYRVGIHMKEYKNQIPVLIIGGKGGNFLGEYMAGGILILLGLTIKSEKEYIAGDYFGTGMHGGVIYSRLEAPEKSIGKEVTKFKVDENDINILKTNITEFCNIFKIDFKTFDLSKFYKYMPVSKRPYGRLYVNA